MCVGVRTVDIPAREDRFNLVELLLTRHLRAGRADRPALLFRSKEISYGELGHSVSRAREILKNRGIDRGDRVGLLIPDVPAYVYIFLAAISLGAIPVPVNPKQNSRDATSMLKRVGAKTTFVHEGVETQIEDAVRVDSMLTGAESEVDAPDFADIVLDTTCAADPLYLLFSSGTSGSPKAIIRRHADILWLSEAFADDVLEMSERDRVLAISKLTFGYSLVGNLLFALLHGAVATLIPEQSTAQTVLEYIDQYRPTILLAQPRMLNELAEASVPSIDLSSLRTVVSAGDVLSEAVRRRWVSRTGLGVIDGFGSTEAGHIFLCGRTGEGPEGSVGRALKGFALKIVDADGYDVPDGTVGRLCIRGESVSPGYWNDAEGTRRSFIEGWFISDDLFTRQDGFYWYCGRWDDVIKTGCGEWVLPNRVEAVLLRDPFVQDCAVVGAHDERDVVRVKAYIVATSTDESNEELALRLKELVQGEWPQLEHMRVHMVEFVSDLPRSANGKLQRHRLTPRTLTEFAYEC